MRLGLLIITNILIPDEFKGHSILEGARQTDLGRVKKYLEVVSFKHPYTGDTALVSNIVVWNQSHPIWKK